MNNRIPLDFPKVWPYTPDYRNHVSIALFLHEGLSGNGHLMMSVGILFIILGLPLFIFPFKIFGYSFLFGITIFLISLPFVYYSNKRHWENFSKHMEEVSKQVSIEKEELRQKAKAQVALLSTKDHEDMTVLDTHATKHYTPNWAWVRNKLLIRDKHSCCLCGRRVQLADSVAHHIDAFSEGGKTEFCNLVTICVECHSVLHPWLNPGLNLFWIRLERGRVYCWKCKSRLDTKNENVVICSDCGWLHHIKDQACGCNYPNR
jgi:5-methylcytosine-specific restriction endonuclease McrA